MAYTVEDYMREVFNYGGEPWPRWRIIEDLQALGLGQRAIDYYMMGLERGAAMTDQTPPNVWARIPESEKRRMKARCATMGISITDAMTRFVVAWLDDTIPLPEPKEEN